MKKHNRATVIENFSKKRDMAEAASEAKRLEIHSLIPETMEIDRELFSTSVKILSIATAGENIEEKMNSLKNENKALREKRAALLVSHGFPADYTDIKYECEKCSDTGFVGMKMCDCFKKAVSLAAFEDSGIGNLVKTQSFETFSLDYYTGQNRVYMESRLKVLMDFANNFEKNKGENFIFMGATGLGKTHLSTSVAKVVLENGGNVVYETIHDIVSAFEGQRFHGTVTEEELTDYFNCDLLIIDDLGCEVSNNFTVSCLYNIINSRINNDKSTIINTNYTQNELRDKYDDRITSRIFGEFLAIVFSGKDIRGQKLAKEQ